MVAEFSNGRLPDLEFLLVILCHMLTVSLAGDNIFDTNEKVVAEKHLEQRRQLPIFPKSNIKFTVTPNPPEKMYSLSPKKKIMTKMPFNLGIASELDSVTPGKIKMVSRKPLMKFRTFTIQTHANGKYDEIEKYRLNTMPITNRLVTTQKSITETDITIKSPEEYKKAQVYLPKENRTSWEKKSHFSATDDKALKNQDNKTVNNQYADDFLLEEEKDRNEFIFLGKVYEKSMTTDILDGEDFDKGEEITTEFAEEKKNRYRRSKNIIEEENMASTVSGLRYTGHDTRLLHDLYFKNINS